MKFTSHQDRRHCQTSLASVQALLVGQQHSVVCGWRLQSERCHPRGCGAHGLGPDGSVGMALTDCRWWFESLLVHSEVSSATRRKATHADHKKTNRPTTMMLGKERLSGI